MPSVLVSDPISEQGIDLLRAIPDCSVLVRTGMTPDELIQVIGEFDALAVRSETKVTAAILAAAPRLRIIGRAGVGVDNIDVAEATRRGVVVVNSPGGNTLAAAEMAIGMMLALARNIPQADAGMKAGRWDRKKYMGAQIFGKTVGIIGLGKIGQAVAQRVAAFEARVIAFDPFSNAESAAAIGAELVTLDDLIQQSDYISVHVPLTAETRGMLGTAQIARMKPGVRLINCARGGIIDEAAAAEAVASGKVAGVGFDVFTSEPVDAGNPLLALPQNVLTPHLGASTEEAQIGVAIDIAEQIAAVLQGQPARSAVNLPAVSPQDMDRLTPYLVLAKRLGSLQRQLAGSSSATAMQVVCIGDFANLPTEMLGRAAAEGLLEGHGDVPVNAVNAPGMLAAQGIAFSTSHRRSSEPASIEVRVEFNGSNRRVTGRVADGEPRVTSIEGYTLDIGAEGAVLMTRHGDRPGVVGRIGTLLGEHGINIAGMHLGRERVGGAALMALVLDSPVDAGTLDAISKLPGIETAQSVTL
ncbi:MAG: phosphoglycerate dehydrogenase [Armatimonadetes bacterium]|nr:phosphoglycerate dehydrogenase [Armatimonadota bacterium]MDE2205956.1 phosphoglycerate dehydrogenase [Armatimonadota bacterium]